MVHKYNSTHNITHKKALGCCVSVLVIPSPWQRDNTTTPRRSTCAARKTSPPTYHTFVFLSVFRRLLYDRNRSGPDRRHSIHGTPSQRVPASELSLPPSHMYALSVSCPLLRTSGARHHRVTTYSVNLTSPPESPSSTSGATPPAPPAPLLPPPGEVAADGALPRLRASPKSHSWTRKAQGVRKTRMLASSRRGVR